MRLVSLQYSEFEGTKREWILEELELGTKNLIVGKNATGKTRTLNCIYGLARLLAGLDSPHETGKFKCKFQLESKIEYIYLLEFENNNVVLEQLFVDGELLLTRGSGGIGEIRLEKENRHIDFQTPTTQLAAIVRRDSLQHKFLEPLFSWASTVRLYRFGTEFGKGLYTIFGSDSNKPDDLEQDHAGAILDKGLREFGNDFKTEILRNIEIVGYKLSDIKLGVPLSIRIVVGIPGEPMGLMVQESDLPSVTDQHSMSQGMFRVLSILIHTTYCQFKKNATCIIIDDIGEGIDYERSCKLIKVLREQSEMANMQIILSTNDRFVMNEVPLSEWSVLKRIKNHIKVFNNANSKKTFEEFKFTGLSNFSFLEFDFINEAEGIS